MNSFAFSLLLGGQAGTNPAPAGPAGMLSNLIPFVLIIGIFYFLIIRPQQKRQKETQRMLNALKKGDKIVTAGGIHGVVQSVKEGTGTVIVKVDENTKIEFSRSAVSTVAATGKPEKAEEKSAEQIEEKSDPAPEEAPKQ